MNAMTLFPAVLLGLVISTMLAAVAHLTRGQSVRDLAWFWLTVQVGFWLTAVVAAWLRAPLFTVGELQLIAGLAGGLLALGLAIVTHKRV